MPRRTTAATHPWNTVSINVMGPFPTIKGKWFIISYSDVFFRYVVLATAADHVAPMVARRLVTDIVAYFGVSAALLSNQGQEFTGHMWEEL